MRAILCRVLVTYYITSCVSPGGDTGQSFIWGGPAGRSNPLPFYMLFFAERYPVSVPSIGTYHSFTYQEQLLYIPGLELCIPFNSCKSTVLQNRNKSKIRAIPEPFLGPFYRRKWQICVPFGILQLMKSQPFHIPEALKRYPFKAAPPCIGRYRECPLPWVLCWTAN